MSEWLVGCSFEELRAVVRLVFGGHLGSIESHTNVHILLRACRRGENGVRGWTTVRLDFTNGQSNASKRMNPTQLVLVGDEDG